MQLSEYVKKLNEKLKEHGDMPIVYAIDDEGNGFDDVHYGPTVMWRTQTEVLDIDDPNKGSNGHKVLCIN